MGKFLTRHLLTCLVILLGHRENVKLSSQYMPKVHLIKIQNLLFTKTQTRSDIYS